MLRDIIYIGIGSGIGGILRYLFSYLPLPSGMANSLPIHTMTANVIGALLLGTLTGWLVTRPDISTHLRLALTVGLCGGFTTYSTFALESWRLIDKGYLLSALLYISLSLLLGTIAVWGGVLLGHEIGK